MKEQLLLFLYTYGNKSQSELWKMSIDDRIKMYISIIYK